MPRERTLLVITLASALALALPAAHALGGAPSASVKHVMPTLGLARAPAANAQAASTNNLIYHDGPIQKTPKVYVDFWCWGGSDPSGEGPYLTKFFQGIGGTAWANIQTQYYETARGNITNPAGQLAGVWSDNSCLAPPVPDAQIAGEAVAASAHFGYSPDADYVIATPHLHNDAEFGVEYCAWHGTTTDSLGRTVAFTDLPYVPDAQAGACGQNFVNPGNAGLLDGVSIVGGHEYAEAITDPHVDAWYDSSGSETGDKCAWIAPGSPGGAADIALATGTFAVQSLWSNANGGCVLHDP
jgi:serine protease